MRNPIGTFVFVLLAALSVAPNVGAQITSPPSPLQGEPAYHVWTVPGVLNNELKTFFACTNVASNVLIVGVEVFGSNGTSVNIPSDTSLTVDPGETVLFGTEQAVGLFPDANLGVPAIFAGAGSARVLSTAKPGGIICTAFLADATAGNPISMTSLTIVKKTTQQGD